ncbi:hypothetical protein HMI56_002260 [Coelomomyces lativittatus]|nr:hypothetical protein HMI56_002260 [Coelomomyces lativittatus]
MTVSINNQEYNFGPNYPSKTSNILILDSPKLMIGLSQHPQLFRLSCKVILKDTNVKREYRLFSCKMGYCEKPQSSYFAMDESESTFMHLKGVLEGTLKVNCLYPEGEKTTQNIGNLKEFEENQMFRIFTVDNTPLNNIKDPKFFDKHPDLINALPFLGIMEKIEEEETPPENKPSSGNLRPLDNKAKLVKLTDAKGDKTKATSSKGLTKFFSKVKSNPATST